MMRAVPIGSNAANELYYVDFSIVPHLFVSWYNEDQIRGFYSDLLNSKPNPGSAPVFAIATTRRRFEVALPYGLLVSYTWNDEFRSSVSSREEFLVFLSKELKRRHKQKLAITDADSKLNRVFPPVVIIMDDVLDVVISAKKAVGLAFLQLLLLGGAVNMQVIAVSSYSCRHLLRQLMDANALVGKKFKKFFSPEPTSGPAIAELIFTSDDFVFFKTAADNDYHRLYPLRKSSPADIAAIF